MALPSLRNLDVFPVEHDGQTLFCLRDPDGIVDAQLLLPPVAFTIAAHLDGESDAAAVLATLQTRFPGLPLTEDDIRAVAGSLDQHGFLYSPAFLERYRRVVSEFRLALTRPAALAGAAYPAEPGELRAFLDAQFTRDGGPGGTPAAIPGAGAPLRCLVVPHIDFHRGGHSYAHGYRRLAEAGKPDVVFLFGVAHQSPPVPFILTRKHFETPLGTVPTHAGIVDALAARCDWDPFEHEIVHRQEHSLEFQAVMLAYLFGAEVPIVPILAGSFCETEAVPSMNTEPAANPGQPGIAAFLNACREQWRAFHGRATVIAGADLAHVGKRFGDTYDIDDTVVQAVARRDREDLALAARGDAGAFFDSVMKDQNARRVCGLNCLYGALSTADLDGRSGDLLHYDYAHDPAGGIVSFCNLLFR